jgi:CheY-like chemotaxis protein/anti-sigma regulatory factor (Ser/Thr protein kinase)
MLPSALASPSAGEPRDSEPAEPGPATALVVDDAPVDRRIAGALVEKATGLRVVYAANGLEALTVLRHEPPCLVLTDLQMPKMNGLDLVEEMRADWPAIPVVLMTACGSEEIAIQALRAGAAGYVPKRNLDRDLLHVLGQVLSAAKVERRRAQFLERMTHFDCTFVLDNDTSVMPLLISHLQEQMERMRLCDANGKIRVGVALEEAFLNAVYHGNLEVSSELRLDVSDAFHRLITERRHLAPYRDRRLHVRASLGPEGARFVLRDEGPGFDVTKLPDPTDPENLVKPSGRGLLLIRTFMDEVRHNETGNEITLFKRRP